MIFKNRLKAKTENPPKGTDVNDSFVNFLLGFGTEKDKTRYGSFALQKEISPIELESIYQNQYFAKVIDIKVFEMLREGWSIKCPELSPEDLNLIEKEEKRLNLKKVLRRSLTDSALYGGSSIFVKFDDIDQSEAINYSSIRGKKIQHLISFDRWNMPVISYDFNVLSENYLMPEYYKVAGSDVSIHSSRVVGFPWFELPLNIRKRSGMFWGNSELIRPYSALINSETLISAITNLVCDANLDIYKIKDLTKAIAGSKEHQTLETRFQLLNRFRSVLSSVIIDQDEELQQRVRQFAGLPEILDSFINIICVAADIPKTRFLGENVAGLGSNGASGLENFYIMIKGLQENRLLSQLYKIYQMICASLFGDVPDDFIIEFNPLWSESKKEKADREAIEINNLINLESLGVQKYMILEEAKKKNLISTLTDEYIQEVKEAEITTPLEDLPDEEETSSNLLPNALAGGTENE